ncbi:hypothetical protein FY134_18290 [Agrobacterium fabrum]|jgi:hypothetical protein|nr:hypothetical protein FY134_18290 [Agrobacterium fabrum]
MSRPICLWSPPSRKSLAHRSGRQRQLQPQMLDVFHQGFYRSAAIAVMPGNDVVYRIGFRFSSFWAHVLILRFKSSNRP